MHSPFRKTDNILISHPTKGNDVLVVAFIDEIVSVVVVVVVFVLIGSIEFVAFVDLSIFRSVKTDSLK